MALKRTLYLTVLRSQVTYCSQVWRLYHIREPKALERLQRMATKYVLNNYQLDYKSRLISLNLLPLTLWMELQDILLFQDFFLIHLIILMFLSMFASSNHLLAIQLKEKLKHHSLLFLV